MSIQTKHHFAGGIKYAENIDSFTVMGRNVSLNTEKAVSTAQKEKCKKLISSQTEFKGKKQVTYYM
jgi:hypothetical protein